MRSSKRQRLVILNSRGEEVTLTAQEAHVAKYLQRQISERYGNSLGSEVDITTLTTILKSISDQKFFEIAPADFLPVVVGQGAWSSALTSYRQFALGDDFETGIVNTAGNNAKLATADAAVDSVTNRVFNWAKSVGWNIMELQQAAKAGSWDIVSSKEKARKKNWDLGVQRIAFLGAKGQQASLCSGLLTQTGVTTNTTLITKPIKNMTPQELKDFTAAIVELYRANCARTTYPTHFAIPESDYNGLAAVSSPDFPIKSVLEILEETLQRITRNKQFKILPLAYGDKAVSGLTVQKYALYNGLDEDSIRIDIPVDYTATIANTVDGFGFQNAAYGQFTGVRLMRPAELMYFAY